MNRWTVIAVTGLLAHAAAAHHSTSMYAKEAPVTIEAEVVEFRWVNPHSNLKVIDTADGSRKEWSIEMSSPGVLTRSGWTKRTFNPGDKIKLEVYRGGLGLDKEIVTITLGGWTDLPKQPEEKMNLPELPDPTEKPARPLEAPKP